jgi:para-nitrobenzyl esterase
VNRTIQGVALAALFGLQSLTAGAAGFAVPTVRVTGGLISGTASSDGRIRKYLGVPFAAPPVADLRWHAPESVRPWDGVRSVAAFGPSCVQPPPPAGNSLQTQLFFAGFKGMSEDCLTLNVWTPAHAVSQRLPVMVWIYGGGFRAGLSSAPLYDGERFARRGVVFVSINYRVWKLGFLTLPELDAESPHGASGNYGLLDQIMGLQWVHDNIGAFGGDPSRVTVFGQSAGAQSVTYLLSSPLAHGLFSRAIVESGGAVYPSSDLSTYPLQHFKAAEAAGTRWAQSLSAPTLEQLRKLTPEQLLAVPEGGRFDSSRPVIDGYALPDSPLAIYTAGKQNDVPLMTGSNANEGTAFGYLKTADALRKKVHNDLGDLADRFMRLYPFTTDAEAKLASESAHREENLSWGTWMLANLQSTTGRSRVFYYNFDRGLPVPPGEKFIEDPYPNVGSTHGAELPYVFGNLGALRFAWTATDRRVSDVMQQYWVNFATMGDPNGPRVPRWTAFDPARPRALRVNDEAAMGPVRYFTQFAFWTGVYLRHGFDWDADLEPTF